MGSRISLWIPSKNRACQLECLLSSIAKNAPNLFNVHIQYTASSQEFWDGYLYLQEKYSPQYPFPQIWTPEQNLVEDFVTAVKRAKSTVFGLSMDDCIWYRSQNTTSDDIEDLLDGQTICFSARLGLNTVIQTQDNGELTVLPNKFDTIAINGCRFLKWNYINLNYRQNFGYPFGQDFHFYRTDLFMNIIDETPFSSLRELESKLCLDRHKYHHIPLMSSFEYSSAFSNPINGVQYGAVGLGEYTVSPEELNRKFLQGHRIDLNKLDFSDVRSCHRTTKLEFVEC